MKSIINVVMGVIYGACAVGLIAVLVWAGFGFMSEVQELDSYTQEVKQEVKQEVEIDTQEPYKYIVSEVNGDEISGLAITHKTDDNGGIVLYKSIDNVDLQVGDIIAVTYGEAFDDIESVKIVD